MFLKILATILLIVLFAITLPFAVLGNLLEKILDIYCFLLIRWLRFLDSILYFVMYRDAIEKLKED